MSSPKKNNVKAGERIGGTNYLEKFSQNDNNNKKIDLGSHNYYLE